MLGSSSRASEPLNGDAKVVEKVDAWNARRIIAGNRVANIAFGPSVDKIGNPRVCAAAALAVRGDGAEFIVHRKTQPDSGSHHQAVAGFKGNGALASDTVHFQKSAVRRMAVMQSCMNDRDIK